MRASLRGREVPILTVLPKLEEAFPAVSRWVKSLGRIGIGIETGQGFIIRAFDESGMVFKDTKSKSLGEALTTLERKIAELDR